jgi:hypothetical protein
VTDFSDFTYTSCQLRDGKSAATRQNADSLKMTAGVSYQVIVDKARVGGGADITPADISTEHIRSLSQLPAVNITTYEYSGLINPYLVCTSKYVTRDKTNGLKFIVDCGFESPDPIKSEQPPQAPPASLTDITPSVASEITNQLRPIWSDKDDKQCWRLPTGTPFTNPIVETVPVLTIIVTQYEASIDFSTMLARSYKLNSATYRNQVKDSWMIGAVKASEVKVKLASGEVTAAKVTYPIAFAANEFKAVFANEPPGQTPAIAYGSTFKYGHLQARPLVDDHYTLYNPNYDPTDPTSVEYTLEPIVDPKTKEPTTGYIKQDSGTLRTPVRADLGDDRPSYMFFRSQDRIDFSTFLQA